MPEEIAIETIEEIMLDAHKRHREYKLSMSGRAVGQTLSEKEHFDWWVLTSAFAKGVEVGKQQSQNRRH